LRQELAVELRGPGSPRALASPVLGVRLRRPCRDGASGPARRSRLPNCPNTHHRRHRRTSVRTAKSGPARTHTSRPSEGRGGPCTFYDHMNEPMKPDVRPNGQVRPESQAHARAPGNRGEGLSHQSSGTRCADRKSHRPRFCVSRCAIVGAVDQKKPRNDPALDCSVPVSADRRTRIFHAHLQNLPHHGA